MVTRPPPRRDDEPSWFPTVPALLRLVAEGFPDQQALCVEARRALPCAGPMTLLFYAWERFYGVSPTRARRRVLSAMVNG